MPRVESELRSRDLEQMLAELTITEEPVPIGTGSRLPRLAGQRDTLALTEVWDTRAQRAGYVALPTNELSNPLFGTSLAGWDTAVASEHTGEVEWDASQIGPSSSANVECANSDFSQHRRGQHRALPDCPGDCRRDRVAGRVGAHYRDHWLPLRPTAGSIPAARRHGD